MSPDAGSPASHCRVPYLPPRHGRDNRPQDDMRHDCTSRSAAFLGNCAGRYQLSRRRPLPRGAPSRELRTHFRRSRLSETTPGSPQTAAICLPDCCVQHLHCLLRRLRAGIERTSPRPAGAASTPRSSRTLRRGNHPLPGRHEPTGAWDGLPGAAVRSTTIAW